jgi:hypothetical protein
VTNLNIAEYLRPSPDYHVIPQGGVPFANLLAGTPQGNALINQGIVTDDGGFPNHDPHAMVDKYARANGSAGVNFNAS